MHAFSLIRLNINMYHIQNINKLFLCVQSTPIYIYTGSETDTHVHCIPGRVAGRNDLSYIVNSGKTHCK